ncbi:MAG: DMT family transporter [Lentimicrobiaceae bacterium]|nr:DMT family transporter [Lentimicrobiaceae bacterium]
MIQSHIGESAALLTAFFWTITALAFEAASKRVGSLTVNILRLSIAFVIFSVFGFFSRGIFFPYDASLHNWCWLALSGLVGFVFGDYMLFRAYVLIGARISMLIMALAPPIAAITGWVMLGEAFSLQHLFGMLLTLSGIALVILKKNEQKTERIRFSYPVKGLLIALGGAAGQGIGLVFSKYGMQDYNAFAASQIRVFTGALGFGVLFFIFRSWKKVGTALKSRKTMKSLLIGSFFGPFLGVSFSLISIQYTTTGIASTIMAIVPVLIIPPSIWFKKEKIKKIEIAGAVIAVIGVAIFFL